ncbi:MAG: rhomboid family intramembrane serine protease [Deltaproteobacteria bacterium]|jgi:membrane associated rhomboid family serine protease|nr:rhomboid family intramembrane serine protease [Deltaproteobacteria bacterium]
MTLLKTRRRKHVDEWALVLTSDGLSPSVRREPEGFALSVPIDEAERAAEVIAAYERENRERLSRPEREAPAKGDLVTGLGVSAALLLFFFFTGPRNPAVIWFERGSADAEKILLGEIWRSVTALCLHADLGHALANALFGALFVSAVCGALGAGVGCALILLAGAGGNLANALFQHAHHVSVGASTAVFGAVGILSGLAVAQRRRQQSTGRPWWVPVGAGLALLAMLGTTGERVDLWAHLFGLLAGGALGIPAGFWLLRPPRPLVQWAFGGVAFLTLLYCWGLALD